MRIRVRMFGVLAERAHGAEASIHLGEHATAGDVVGEMRRLYPDVAPVLEEVSVAVNLEVVPAGHPVGEEDEVALLPPVSGGAGRVHVALSPSPSVEEALRLTASPEAGAAVAFVGTVRAGGGTVDRLEYSAYPEMAERVLREIADEAVEKWGLEGVAVVHGMGTMEVSAVTVVVACSAPHRAEAFDACRYVIDEVKARVPVWKKESGPGGERWVGS